MMTELQQKRAHALSHCNLPFGGTVRQFVRDMVSLTKDPALAIISPNQDRALAGYCWKFREQLRNRGHAELIPDRDPYEQQKPAPVAQQEEMRLL